MKNFQLFFVLLTTLTLGVTNAWAEEVTYVFTSKDWTANIGSTVANWTSNMAGAGFSNNGIQVTAKATGANGTSPISYNNISQIVVTYNTNKNKGNGTLSVKIGDNAVTTNNWQYSGNADGTSANFTSTFDYSSPQSGKVTLTANTTTNSIYVVSIKIVTSAGGGETPDPEPEPDPTPDPGTGGTGTINFNSNAVTINAASVTGNDDLGNTWTITTVGTTSYTANNEYYQVGKSSEPATSITFTTTLPQEGTITDFSAKFGGFSNTAGTVTLKVDDTSVGTGSLNGKSDVVVKNSSEATGKTLTVTVTGIARGVKAYYISYTYTTSSGDSEEPILSSIEISGDLTDKIYEEGEDFDFSGLIVQANYENGDPKDITNDVEWSYTPNPLTKGTTSVYVTATYEDKTATKTINGLTVNEHIITPGEYCITPNNDFWGTSYTGTDAAAATTLSGKQNDITILHARNTSGSLYVNDTQTRAYAGHTMNISVPTGYVITDIAFTKGTSWEGTLSADCGTINNTNWTGTNQNVTITFNDGKCFITKICVTYIKDVKYALTITEPTAGTGTLVVKDGENVLTSGAEIYEGTKLTIIATPETGFEDGVVVVKNASDEDITATVYADGTLTMPAHPITISATFERKPCSLLSTPTVSATTTYNTATLTWNAVENAQKYSVQIGATEAVETTETSYEVTGLKADTQYTYYIQAIAADDQFDYCNSELAEGSFTTSQAPIATLILSENGETHDLDGEHSLYEIVTLPNTAATCTKTFVGWSADANCTTAPEYAPGASYTLSELTQTLYAVYATANGAETKYIKLTTTPTPSFAGTYLIVNEENKVAFNGGLETLDAVGNTISVVINDATIETSTTVDNATFDIWKNQSADNYFITSKSGKYIGRTTDANELDESTETEYTNTISIDADGNANIIGSGGAYLRYNATSGQERFRYYQSATYTNQKAIALYKKYSIPLYTNYTTYCGDDITISSGTTQTFNTDQQINTLIIEGGATANLVAGNIEINTIILEGGLKADATDYKMPILYTNGATIDVDHLYLNLAINHNTYYPFAVPFPVSVSDIDYANPTLAAASEYGTHYLIKRYDGAKRAKEGVNKDVNWVVVETDETLQPGVGYIISALTGKSETTTTIQIPLTFEPEQNSTLSIIAHTGTAAANDPIQKGWNFIAHPYLSKYAGSNINNAPRYVSIPTYNFSAYQQTMLMATTLSPEYPFFVQIGEDTEINFTTEGRCQTPASVRADENNQILNLLFNILLADKAQDQTGIILDNSCTPAYEINADLEKMFGSEFTTSIYTLCQDMRLAFNAMSFENAQSFPIPLGYRAAEAGEYTINLDIIEDASAYENLYEGIVLYDSATEIKTNLLYADYTFTTDKIQDDTRFSIQFVPKNNAPTHIENIPHYQTTQKIILNNQLYIIHNGQIYNITGQNIR